MTVEQLEERYCLINPAIRDASLVSLLMKFQEENSKDLCIIFTETCKNCQVINKLFFKCFIICD